MVFECMWIYVALLNLPSYGLAIVAFEVNKLCNGIVSLYYCFSPLVMNLCFSLLYAFVLSYKCFQSRQYFQPPQEVFEEAFSSLAQQERKFLFVSVLAVACKRFGIFLRPRLLCVRVLHSVFFFLAGLTYTFVACFGDVKTAVACYKALCPIRLAKPPFL